MGPGQKCEDQKSTYYYILCYFPIQFCVSLCIGCTGKRSGISVKGLRKFLSSKGLCCLCTFSHHPAHIDPCLHIGPFHYANMSVQYTAIFHGCKNDNF